MSDPDEPQGPKDSNQQQFSVSNGSAHFSCSPYMQEFSELVSKVSINVLKFTLLTYQQRLFAEALWEAANYGGSESKCKKRLQELYGDHWRSLTRIEDHMEPVRPYYELVLLLDHEKQWASIKKDVKLHTQHDKQ